MARPRGHVESYSDDRHRIEIALGLKPDGARDRYREMFYGPRKLAKVRLRELTYKFDKGRFLPSAELTYGEFLEDWLENQAKPPLKELRTYEEYERHANLRIIPALGSIVLTKLTALDIDRFYAGLLQEGARKDKKRGGLSPSTIHKVHAVVRQSLQYAVAPGKLIEHNPANDVTLPKKTKPAKRFWNAEQLAAFIDHIDTHPYKALIYVLAFTGMRVSEAYALTWDDIDFYSHIIRISKNLKKPGRDPIVGDVKNHQERSVTMDDELIYVLQEHRQKQTEYRRGLGTSWKDYNLVFTTEIGSPMHRGNFHQRIWKPIMEALAKMDPPIPYLNIHGVRHTFATLMMRSGIKDPKILTTMLGHNSVAFTLDQYDHPDEDDQREAIAAFSRQLKRVK